MVGAVRLLRQRSLEGHLTGVVADAMVVVSALPEDDDRDLRGDIAAAESRLDDLGVLIAPDQWCEADDLTRGRVPITRGLAVT